MSDGWRWIECSNKLRLLGVVYPRTCALCGLGPCRQTPEPEQHKSSSHQRAVEALTAIRAITSQTYTEKDRVYTALSLIDQLARKGLT